MADPDLDLVLLERLVRAPGWREYREHVLLPAYQRVSQMLDVATEDHRYLQGLKEGLRFALEDSYRLLGLPLPTPSPGVRLARERRGGAKGDAETEPVVLAPVRPSYLA